MGLISEHMERLVMLIKGDEPSQGPSEEEEFELAATRNRLELEGSSTLTKPEAVDTEEDGPAIGSLVTTTTTTIIRLKKYDLELDGVDEQPAWRSCA
ncbi:Protein hgh1 [Marasmius tenuissimus]|uniref:Protein hgh1 n=1 Tax=Marasmius tenuissimus TaxID=585030 RepID=A0ABR2ZCU5_9AGAR